jgi:medium-chain acyl-[acyl-carrier-protein] hydrolase
MPEQVKRNPWIAFRKGGHHSRARFFCFPYAGAGASVFRSWGDYLSPEFEVIGVQLPGREERLRDELFVRIEPMVESAARGLCSDLTPPFAFFGHSMGSILAYELACFLRRNGLPQPVHIFASGRRGPQAPRRYEPFHELPDAQFIERLRELNGTPEEVFQHPELLAFMLPTLKADFAVCENYLSGSEPQLECPVSALGGLDDADVSREDLSTWGAITRGRFRLEMFTGDHFFLHASRPAVLAAVAADLQKTLLSRIG